MSPGIWVARTSLLFDGSAVMHKFPYTFGIRFWNCSPALREGNLLSMRLKAKMPLRHTVPEVTKCCHYLMKRPRQFIWANQSHTRFFLGSARRGCQLAVTNCLRMSLLIMNRLPRQSKVLPQREYQRVKTPIRTTRTPTIQKCLRRALLKSLSSISQSADWYWTHLQEAA